MSTVIRLLEHGKLSVLAEHPDSSNACSCHIENHNQRISEQEIDTIKTLASKLMHPGIAPSDEIFEHALKYSNEFQTKYPNQIDPELLDLCKLTNSNRVAVLNSCSGHGVRPFHMHVLLPASHIERFSACVLHQAELYSKHLVIDEPVIRLRYAAKKLACGRKSSILNARHQHQTLMVDILGNLYDAIEVWKQVLVQYAHARMCAVLDASR